MHSKPLERIPSISDFQTISKNLFLHPYDTYDTYRAYVVTNKTTICSRPGYGNIIVDWSSLLEYFQTCPGLRIQLSTYVLRLHGLLYHALIITHSLLIIGKAPRVPDTPTSIWNAVFNNLIINAPFSPPPHLPAPLYITISPRSNASYTEHELTLPGRRNKILKLDEAFFFLLFSKKKGGQSKGGTFHIDNPTEYWGL